MPGNLYLLAYCVVRYVSTFILSGIGGQLGVIALLRRWALRRPIGCVGLRDDVVIVLSSPVERQRQRFIIAAMRYSTIRHGLTNRLQCIAIVWFMFPASSTARDKECDQSANEKQCDNPANNATDESSVEFVV